ncbi:MAG: acetolactate decarboxylase [Phycisphaera sp.]|nr:acetolactate decarboxylase [Phycisphaera sp.]
MPTMKTYTIASCAAWWCAALIGAATLGGCAGDGGLAIGGAGAPHDTLTQVSTIDALLAGQYDGHISCGEMLRHGGFGLGTFDALDGEMVVLGGHVYQVRSDGHVYTPGPDTPTPFATVCRFRADDRLVVEAGTTWEALQQQIDARLGNVNYFYAVKLTGRFKVMKTRAVPAQAKPYPELADAAKGQSVFDMTEVSGTLVGFRCPPYVTGMNVPGYHVHFLTDDRRAGGHVLDLELANTAVCEIDRLDRYEVLLPSDPEALRQLDLSKDRGKELNDVERGGGK